MKFEKPPFWWLVITALLLNLLAQAIHEGGHLLVYALAGHGPVWRFTGLVQRWEAAPPPHPETWLGAGLLGMIPSAALMVLLDPIIQTGVEQGNSWFTPILGFSLPVFVTHLLMLAGLFLLHRSANRAAH